MKQLTLNLICLTFAILSGIGMFLLKYHVLDQEKELGQIRRQIIEDRRELHVLKADWAVLTDPQHLRELIKGMKLKPYHGQQIVNPNELEDRNESEEVVSQKGENHV